MGCRLRADNPQPWFILISVRDRKVLFALGALLAAGCGGTKPAGPANISAAYRMGDEVRVGPLVYMVTETEWLDQLGNPPALRIPRRRFLTIGLTVTNGGTVPATVPAFTLSDPQGQTYPEATGGEDVKDWLGSLRLLGPAETRHGRVLFDAPTGPYKLQIASGGDPGRESFVLVDIPLQLPPAPLRSEPRR